ncbi:hypothetical protein Achl_3458 [Pseudarthrobacter chlorophenolicus A6]|uniref:Uncharacterized protein n=1 Tax=Pseudarthrobacter chlorophenolicus (strain ATCC 700700 / DSM 12829 / CIP 107037 / JCM 12360 / KCTC 9906 / NCIMB 13794 / A6) TaxID=452863 RepID=B8HHC4_PSECP|nr:hypothetical protein Achl_3458 [Pseudarthrobacter chlorophenolicus A6]SDQ64559.1 hypothetical protein SAMN04489738_2021 [Pseudarthrobacter chlorophenolicus]
MDFHRGRTFVGFRTLSGRDQAVLRLRRAGRPPAVVRHRDASDGGKHLTEEMIRIEPGEFLGEAIAQAAAGREIRWAGCTLRESSAAG